ncbi:energy-coupling factor ABC transporter ATP-binding protein [Natronincola ferrireducens]|uniref:Cobalt/nickel transport system ATP-binding protein n=1 Tax=Natronincola ferrireducens TaxID=393762 RepID=A0A1G9FQU7_9FIRM|nr:ABC transporter ATP-binding protein [Natronincola ferrireducens]SDK90722.1 cobalt/nickel transport system ATP-binding protein [Natronincola ferrireducens]
MVIKIRDLSFTYPNNHRGLIDVSLDIESGKKTAILGVNGSGKSTLLYHLNGITLPQTGSVEVLNMDVKEKNLRKIRREVGFLFDYPDHQLFSTTVYRDIKFGLDNYKYPEKQKDECIRKAARALRIEELLEYPPYQLSLGQKKKVAIAGLIVLEPSIILCDEPFSGLDGYTLIYFKELLNDWVKEGKTIVFSTHDVDLTYEWADNVIILRDGKVLKSGTASEVLTKEETYLEAGLVKPMLYDLFQDSEYKPQNIREAKEHLSKKFAY